MWSYLINPNQTPFRIHIFFSYFRSSLLYQFSHRNILRLLQGWETLHKVRLCECEQFVTRYQHHLFLNQIILCTFFTFTSGFYQIKISCDTERDIDFMLFQFSEISRTISTTILFFLLLLTWRYFFIRNFFVQKTLRCELAAKWVKIRTTLTRDRSDQCI